MSLAIETPPPAAAGITRWTRQPGNLGSRRSVHQVTAAITAAGWFAVALLSTPHTTAMSDAEMASPAAHLPRHDVIDGPAGWLPSSTWVAMWVAMSVAMMLPLAAPGLEPILRRTYRRWRLAVGSTFLTGYLTLWLTAGIAARAAYRAVADGVSPVVWTTAWLVVGVAVAWTPRRRALLSRCHRRLPQPPRSLGAVAVAARSAGRLWQRCALLCGPAMLAMVPIANGMWVVMVAGTGAGWWEQRHPRAWRDPVPIGLLAAAAATVVVLDVIGGG